jgi:group I intron endonuclease
MDKKSGVYQITNKADGKKYVGSSSDIDRRRDRHFSRAKSGTHENKKLQNAFNEHGQDSFIFSVLEYCDESLLIQREQFYIDALRPEYNLSPTAGCTKGVKLSQATKNKLSASHMGKKHTQEAREKMSIARMGNTYALGSRHKHTQEHKNKISIARRAYYARLKQQGEQNV